jgi:hypothetical protein
MMVSDTMVELVISLPTGHATARMRAWRALKATGAAVLRDGVYLLPTRPDLEEALETLATEVREAGGSAHVLRVEARDEGQARVLRALFDRTREYAALAGEIARVRDALPGRNPAAVRRQMRAVRRQFDTLAAIDFFPGEARGHAEAVLTDAETAALDILRPGEPRASRGPIPRLDPAAYRHRVWATRQAPWVDRLASAWLIKRRIDPGATFLWLARPDELPRDAVGFDFDGACFTHVDNRVTFEVLLQSFGLDGDPALARMAALVHYLDVGGLPAGDAPGVVAMLAGARQQSRDDDELLARALGLLDLLYAGYAAPPGEDPG